MQKLNAFIDLDGPLLDVLPRHHGVYAHILGTWRAQPLAPSAFWQAKRRRMPDRDILAMSGVAHQAAAYEQQKQRFIEDETFLQLDRLQSGALTTLAWLKQHRRLVLVTLRRHPDRVRAQLERLGLAALLDDVLVGGEAATSEGGWKIKVKLVADAGISCCPADVFIGDTETDVRAGQALHVRTVAVCNGIREGDILAAVQPTLLLPDLAGLTPAMVG